MPPNPADDFVQDSIGFRAEFAKTFSEYNRTNIIVASNSLASSTTFAVSASILVLATTFCTTTVHCVTLRNILSRFETQSAPMLLSAPRVYVCYASCDYAIHHPTTILMYTHRISGVVHGVKRFCYLFLDRLLQDVLICSRRGLASKTHSLISHLPQLSPWGVACSF